MDSQWIGIGSLVLAVLLFLYSIGRDIKKSIAKKLEEIAKRFEEADAKAAKRDQSTHELIATSIGASEARLIERIDAVKEHSDKRIDDLHAIVVAGFAQANAQLSVLETRTYEIGRALPPPVATEPHAS